MIYFTLPHTLKLQDVGYRLLNNRKRKFCGNIKIQTQDLSVPFLIQLALYISSSSSGVPAISCVLCTHLELLLALVKVTNLTQCFYLAVDVGTGSIPLPTLAVDAGVWTCNKHVSFCPCLPLAILPRNIHVFQDESRMNPNRFAELSFSSVSQTYIHTYIHHGIKTEWDSISAYDLNDAHE